MRPTSKPIFARLFPGVLCAIVACAYTLCLHAEIRLAPFFSDGMVLQRDTVAPLWGKAEPNEAITAQLNGQTVTTIADDKGNWATAFKGLAAGGPFTLTIKGGAETATLSNVLVGDVWLCVGEANLDYSLAQTGVLAKDDIAAAGDPQLRWFSPKFVITGDPYQGKGWTDTTPDAVAKDSAVAYYFARDLRQKINVPMGIIVLAASSAPIEGWLSPEGLASLGMGPETQALLNEYANLDMATAKFLSDLAAWEKTSNRQDPGNKGFAQGWADPKTDTNDWQRIANLGDWSSLGIPNGGVVWVRKSVDLPAEIAGKDISLDIGSLRYDGKEFGKVLGTVYFNNRQVGTIGDSLKHFYITLAQPAIKVPGNLVVAGSNVIAVRFFTQEPKAIWKKTELRFNAAAKTAWPAVTPEWLAKVEATLPPQSPQAAGRPVPPPSPAGGRMPSLYYRAMLKPIVGYGFKGIISYQGEANTEVGTEFTGDIPSVLGNYNPVYYRKQLPAFIADLRRLWNQANLPFYFVQLPPTNTHIKPNGQPQKGDWAPFRESQLVTWQTVPHTAMIVAIDVGDGDVHSPVKKPIGQRLALAALANAYGQNVSFSGPIYQSMAVEGNKIRLKFNYVGGGLITTNGPLTDFAIAGADHKFVWGDAVIDGDTVVVSSPSIAAPVAVRYGWLDTPLDCHLDNKEGLPASPFRTDDWPLP